MEQELGDELFNILKNDAAIAAVVPSERIAPLYVPQKVNPPFIVYRINEVPGDTKDSEKYNVFVVLVFPEFHYNDCMAMKKLVKAALDNKKFDFVESDTDVDDDNNNVVCVLRCEATVSKY